MATQDLTGDEAGFELVALPTPTTVRDPDTGNVVDGFDVRIRSTKTGATATLEIPASRYSVEYVAAQAKAKLAPLDETIERFGASTLTGASAGNSG